MDNKSTDAIVATNLSPITLKVDNLIKVTIGGDIRKCEVCGEPMEKHVIYPYNSPAEKVFICENKKCSEFGKYTLGGRAYGV